MKENKNGKQLKTEPKLKIELNQEQKEVVALFYQYDVIFVKGDFGSGKSLVASHVALTAFRKKMFNEIWITRPIIDKMGALPGDTDQKMAPWVFPIVQNLEACQGKEATDKMLKEGQIKIIPISMAKGVTFMNAAVIVDEFQDMDYQDFRTILTRLGKGSKMIFCGSNQQIEEVMRRFSCIYRVDTLEHSGLVGFKVLTSNHRNPVLTDIIDFLENKE